MKIHMDYLEGKVEKFEKEQKQHDSKVQSLAQQFESLQSKYVMLKEDRDEKDSSSKKLKS